MPLSLEPEDRAVFGRASGQDSFPYLIRLGDLAGARPRGRQEFLLATLSERDLAIHGLLILADAIDQAVARGDEEETAEVVHVGEAPAGFAEPAEQVGPGRLDDVGRVELGAE